MSPPSRVTTSTIRKGPQDTSPDLKTCLRSKIYFGSYSFSCVNGLYTLLDYKKLFHRHSPFRLSPGFILRSLVVGEELTR